MTPATVPISGVTRRAFDRLRESLGDTLAYGLVFRLVAMAVLTPAIALVARGLFALSGRQAVANADLLAFALSPGGAATLLALVTSIAAVEVAGLSGTFAIAYSAVDDRRLGWIDAVRFVGRRAVSVIRITLAIVLDTLATAAPFLVLIGGAYLLWLGDHDINYYLTEHPPEFWQAIATATLLGIAMVVLVVRRLVGWTLGVPIMMLEDVSAGEARRRSRQIVTAAGTGRTFVALAAGPLLVAVAAVCVVAVIALIGDLAMETAGQRLRVVALTLGAVASLQVVVAFGAGVVGAAAAVFVAATVHASCAGTNPLPPPPAMAAPRDPGVRPPLRKRSVLALAVVLGSAALMTGASLIAGIATPDRVVRIAHRAGAAHGPENSLAALRAAIAAGADFAEIDVQLSADDVVVVVHDRDLMKLAGRPWRIAETPSAQLRTADIGDGEHLATLAEFCETARGRIGLCVELKYYGWDERLAPATLDVLRRAGVLERCEFMSLEVRAARQLRALAPELRIGYLSSVALGDLSRLDVEFLAVANGAATTALIAAAHSRGLDVYAWTLNDAESMSDAIDRGIDGVITDDPPLLAAVLDERSGLTDLERLALRFGALHDP